MAEMDKNKAKQRTSYTRELTAMEIAFLNARAQKEKAELSDKTEDAEQATAPESSGTNTSSKHIKTLDPGKPAQVGLSRPQSISQLSTSHGRQPSMVKTDVIDKPALSTVKAPIRTAAPPVKMHFKPIATQSYTLDAVGSNCEKSIDKWEDSIRNEISLRGKTQCCGISYNDERDIVIGFDFGTSSSKVVIRDSALQTAYAVPFGEFSPSGNIYLMPTRLFICEDGYISLSAGTKSCRNIKSQLMENPTKVILAAENVDQNISVSELAVGYIGMVIRLARDWFLKHTETIYKKTRIYWHVNLGIPSKNYDNAKERKIFRAITMAAWKISLSDSMIHISDVIQTFEKAARLLDANQNEIDSAVKKEAWLHPDYVNTHPEVIMEVVGYARSTLRTNGLHLLVDVGATTLDAATFIIHSHEDEDLFPLLDTSVQNLGTMILHNKRIETLKFVLEKSLQQKNVVDPVMPFPATAHYEVQVDKASFSEMDMNFFNECGASIGSVVNTTRKKRDPYSDVWHKELPVFICGGGRRMEPYRATVIGLGAKFAQTWNDFKGFAVKDIPMPDQLQAPLLASNDYDRLAVAYGLSFTSDEIGEVVPESKTPDIKPIKRILNTDSRYISKEMC
jgi:hypothetical protein